MILPAETTFKGGLELKFFEQGEFESVEGIEYPQQLPIIARNILRFFTMGWTKSWTHFLTPYVLYSFFIQRNPELLKEVRFAMQQGLFHIFDQLKGKIFNTEQTEQVHLYLSNCMSMLPYGDLTPYESFKIPQCIDGQWELIEYQVIPIELTETKGWRSYFTQEHDRVFAYGLKPLLQKKAESHLIFMGTTYPAGQGFLTQVKTDSKGFESVGRSLYHSGRQRIHHWLSQQENTIHVCGVSLGGSLSLLLAIDKGNYTLSRVDALNPPGLYDLLSQGNYDYWDDLIKKPKVVVQKQGEDPVSAFGLWKKDWHILQVTPPEDKRGPNAFCDHCLNYAGFADTVFTLIPAEHDNSKRSTSGLLINALSRTFLYYYILVPYTYAWRPFGYYALNRFFVREEEQSSSKKLSNTAKLHHPSLPRNTTMDIYDEKNALEIELTYQQINTYYQVTRCLLKGKDFLPDKEVESKHVKGISKIALLKESSDSEKAHIKLPFKATKAKISRINHTLTLVHQFGIHNKEILKEKLVQHHEAYQAGKKV